MRVRLERWSFVALYEPFELVFATALGGRLLCLHYNFDTVTRFAHHSNHLFQTNLAPALWCARPLTHYRYLRSVQAISSRVTLPFFALLLSADYSNDLYLYNPATRIWTALSPSGTIPSKRQYLGFTTMPDGTIYAFGGIGYSGDSLEIESLGARACVRAY